MTRSEALKEARRRWGPSAKVWTVRKWSRVDGIHMTQRRVGFSDAVVLGMSCYERRSYEATWEAAFVDADRRTAIRIRRAAAMVQA